MPISFRKTRTFVRFYYTLTFRFCQELFSAKILLKIYKTILHEYLFYDKIKWKLNKVKVYTMDFKQNALFFNHKRTRFWTTLSYTSYFFFAIAVVVLISTMGWVAAALPFASVGVVILLTSLSMITSEKLIKEQIALLQKGAKEKALEHFD